MKKIVTLITLAIVMTTLLGCGKDSDVTVLKLGHGLPEDHLVHKSLLVMAEKVSEKSHGKIKLEIFANEVLGSEKEMIEQVQLGLVAMTKTSTAPLESFIPVMGVFGVPYIFRDNDHYWNVLSGPIGKNILQAGYNKGLLGLCFYDSGSRSFYTKDKPIKTPANLKDMKIRVQQSKTAMTMVKQLGASPTPIDWGELYTALQQGVVDGAENNPPSFYTSRHYEVCKHYCLDEHTCVPDMIVISTTVWNRLSEDERRIIQEAADESSAYEREQWGKMTQESLEKVAAAGVTIYHPDKELFRQKVQEMHQSYKGSKIGTLIEEIEQTK
jgi:tripartite ATP-independent transporter DctP family solute receptor